MMKAARTTGNTGENLLVLLERRLDNVIFSLGLTLSRNHARQMISHGHFFLNGRKCDIPSALVKTGDTIRVRDKDTIKKIIHESMEQSQSKGVPSWLEQDPSQFGGKVKSLPERENVQFEVDEQLIVEFMSK